MTDTELLEMLRRGRLLEALEGFMKLYHSALIRRAETLIARYEVPLTSDEVVSDVWSRFVMHDARRQITSVKGILMSMVRTEVYQYWRRSRLSGDALPDVADPVSIESEVISQDEAERLEREIVVSSDLNTNQLDSLILRHKYELPIQLIAQVLNLKPTSVPVIVSNAKKRIREQFGSADYTPKPLTKLDNVVDIQTELDNLMYKIYENHLTCVRVYAHVLSKQKAGSP